MVDKVKILKDLVDLEYAHGLFCGRWEEEKNMDFSSEEYLATVIMFAEVYNIEYDKNLEHYIQDEEYEAKCYTMEYMADVIHEKVLSEIVELLLNG